MARRPRTHIRPDPRPRRAVVDVSSVPSDPRDHGQIDHRFQGSERSNGRAIVDLQRYVDDVAEIAERASAGASTIETGGTRLQLPTTEPRDGQVLTFDAATKSLVWRSQTSSARPPGWIDGLVMSHTGVSNPLFETVSVGPGSCRDSNDEVDIELTETVTADISSGGVNGLDFGSLTNSTWYALYVISGPSVNTQTLISRSFSGPTLMPGGYTHFRRVGAIYRDVNSNIIEFVQHGNGRSREVVFTNPNTNTNFDVDMADGNTASDTVVTFMPPQPYSTRARINFYYTPPSNNSFIRFCHTSDTATQYLRVNAPVDNQLDAFWCGFVVYPQDVDGAQTIWVSNSNSGGVAPGYVSAYWDEL